MAATSIDFCVSWHCVKTTNTWIAYHDVVDDPLMLYLAWIMQLRDNEVIVNGIFVSGRSFLSLKTSFLPISKLPECITLKIINNEYTNINVLGMRHTSHPE